MNLAFVSFTVYPSQPLYVSMPLETTQAEIVRRTGRVANKPCAWLLYRAASRAKREQREKAIRTCQKNRRRGWNQSRLIPLFTKFCVG